MKRVVSAVAASFFLASTASGQSPSYGETVSFIKGKLNTVTTKGNEKITSSFLEIGQCNFRHIEKSEGLTVRFMFDYKFSMSDIDPSSIQVSVDNVGMTTTNRKKNIWHRFTNNDGMDNKKPLDEIWFRYLLHPAEENAVRTAKALQHLSKICGGKKQLF